MSEPNALRVTQRTKNLPAQSPLPSAPNFSAGSTLPATASLGHFFYHVPEHNVYQRVPATGGDTWKNLTEASDLPAGKHYAIFSFGTTAAIPATGSPGEMYFDTTDQVLYMWLTGDANTNTGIWSATGITPTGVNYTAGAAFPGTATLGDVHYKTDEGVIYRYVDDVQNPGNSIWSDIPGHTLSAPVLLRFTSGATFPTTPTPNTGDRHFHTVEGAVFTWLESETAWVELNDEDNILPATKVICDVTGTKRLTALDSGLLLVADDASVLQIPTDLGPGFYVDIMIVEKPMVVTPLTGVSLNGESGAITHTAAYTLQRVISYGPNLFALTPPPAA